MKGTRKIKGEKQKVPRSVEKSSRPTIGDGRRQ